PSIGRSSRDQRRRSAPSWPAREPSQAKENNSMATALQGSKHRRKFFLPFALAVLVSGFGGATLLSAASSGAVHVFAAADDGRSLAPIAEMTGAGGVKWFMVKTKSGNVGWIKAGAVSAAKIDDHFRALPKDSGLLAPSVTAEPASGASAAGAITIPVRIDGAKVVVPVTFRNGYNSSTGYLAVDTGAAQTMVSRRIAR